MDMVGEEEGMDAKYERKCERRDEWIDGLDTRSRSGRREKAERMEGVDSMGMFSVLRARKEKGGQES